MGQILFLGGDLGDLCKTHFCEGVRGGGGGGGVGGKELGIGDMAGFGFGRVIVQGFELSA